MQDSLEKQLICPICLEVFTKPVVILPCQHNLCRKCANDVFQAANPYMTTRTGGTVTSGGRFRCPSCRHEVVLDRHGVYGLQRNLLVENIIDMMKQGSSSPKPLPEPKVEQPMCEQHTEEKINIYCVTCGVPTCSMCKVFGAHKDCEVAPLNNVFTKQKGELTDCISMLVGNNERLQAIITQLEETCRTIDENGRRQKSKVCETFDHLYAILEEKKTDMTLQISGEQEEKLDYIRCLRRRYTEHLESMAKVLETGIQTMEQSEMAVFLQDAKPLLQKIIEGTNTSHLEKVERGYEIFDHFTTNFERQRRALHELSFIIPDEEEDEESEEELMLEVPTAALPQPVGVPKSPLPPQSLVGGATLPPLPKSPQPPQSLVGGTAMPSVPKSPLPPQPAAGSASLPVARSPQPPLLSGSSAVPSPRSPQPPLGAVGSVAFPTQPMGAGTVAFPPLHQRPAEGLSATPPVAFPSSQAPSQATPPVAFPSSQAPSQATPPVAFPTSQAPSQATPPVAFPSSQAPSQATPPVAFPTSPATPSQATAASQPQASSDPSGGGEDVDGPRHVFSFSWLNQK